jgi:hypothetical protein
MARDVALRFARLQKRWGPWGLAWWGVAALADQRASRRTKVDGDLVPDAAERLRDGRERRFRSIFQPSQVFAYLGFL